MQGQLEVISQEAKTLQDLKDAGVPNQKITFGDVIDDVKHAQATLGAAGFDQYRSQLNKDIVKAGLPPISIVDVENGKLVVDISGVMMHAKYNRCGVIESYTDSGVEKSLPAPACDATPAGKKP